MLPTIIEEGTNKNENNENKSPKRRMSAPVKKRKQTLQLRGEVANSLNPTQLKQVHKVSEDFLNEREVKQLRLVVQERDEQSKIALDIIKNLEKENEDLKNNVENLKNQLHTAVNELKILETKLITMNENYEQEKKECDFAMKEKEDKIQELTMMNNKNANDNENSNPNEKTEQKEKNLMSLEIEELKKKINERDLKLERCMEEIEKCRNMEEEYKKCKEEIKSHLQLRQEDSLQWKSMEKEVIELASRNSFLENDKTDLLKILEERDCEILQLKTVIEMKNPSQHNNSNPNFYKVSMNRIDDDNETLDHMMNENAMSPNYASNDKNEFDNCEFEEEFEEEFDNDAGSMENENDNKNENQDVTIENIHLTESKKSSFDHLRDTNKKDVPSVVKEYLYLTASAVKIKFPSVTTITSEQLIAKVQHVPFCDYHDQMVRIMKNEKINIEAEKNRLKQSSSHISPSNDKSSFISKFRQFFSNVNDKNESNPTPNENNKNNKNTKEGEEKDTIQLQEQPSPSHTMANENANVNQNNDKKSNDKKE